MESIETDKNNSYSEICWSVIFIMMALPLHASNKILKYLSISGMISIFHLALVLLIILGWYGARVGIIKINKRSGLILLFVIAFIWAMVTGVIRNNELRNVIGDSSMYLLAFAVFCLVSSPKTKALSLQDFLYLTYKAITISCVLSLIMYITRSWSFWGMQSFNGGRYFGGYLSLLAVTIPYAVYDYFYIKKIKIVHLIFHIGVALFCIMLAQSRTVVFSITIGVLAVLIFGHKNLSLNSIAKFLGIIVIGLITVVILINSDSALMDRLLSTDLDNTSETTYARLYLYRYYVPSIFHQIMGFGFGGKMYFMTPQLNIIEETETYTVDSAILTAGYKGGILLLLIFLLACILPVLFSLSRYKKTKDIFYFCFGIWFMLLVFATVLITGQIIHTFAVLTFFWSVVGICLKEKNLSESKMPAVLNEEKQ